MLFLDLRWVLFVALALTGVVWWAGPWVGRPPRGATDASGIAQANELWPAVDAAPFGLLLLDGSGTCRHANGAARSLLRLPSPPCALPDAPWVRLLHADREALRRAGAASGSYRSVAVLGEQSGRPALAPEPPSRVVRWWVTAAGEREQDAVFLLDVTEQARAEEASRTLVSELSHELRTPLATVLAHLEVLGLPALPPETYEQSVGLLKAEARRMGRLVHQLLELGRVETTSDIARRPVDLQALAEEAVRQVTRPAGEREVALSLAADAPLPPVAGDRDRLYQVFLNLLDNAVKYCRPGDQVTVSLRGEGLGVRCAVRDSGPGIPASHLPHLGQRFYRAGPPEVEGSGLGLALVAEILRRHGSRLEIESEAGGAETGTTAHFLLPALGVAAAT